MITQMGEVLPNLFVGSLQDALDRRNLSHSGISHIVSIMDNPKREQVDKHYLCIMAYDSPEESLSQYFSVCNDFIHEARLNRKSVLIHCLGGASRSVTLAIAYIMTVTNLSWEDALNVVRAERCIALPNIGFLQQLEEFQSNRLNVERYRLKYKFPSAAFEESDKEWCTRALKIYDLLFFNNPKLFDPVPKLCNEGSENATKFGLNPFANFRNVTKRSSFGSWSSGINSKDVKKGSGETLMANVRLYRPMQQKDRDTHGKFVKPIDTFESSSEIFEEDEDSEKI